MVHRRRPRSSEWTRRSLLRSPSSSPCSSTPASSLSFSFSYTDISSLIFTSAFLLESVRPVIVGRIIPYCHHVSLSGKESCRHRSLEIGGHAVERDGGSARACFEWTSMVFSFYACILVFDPREELVNMEPSRFSVRREVIVVALHRLELIEATPAQWTSAETEARRDLYSSW